MMVIAVAVISGVLLWIFVVQKTTRGQTSEPSTTPPESAPVKDSAPIDVPVAETKAITEEERKAQRKFNRTIYNRSFRVAGFTKPALSGRGIRHLLYAHIERHQVLRLVPHPDNPVSEEAVLIYPADGELRDEDLGYVPHDHAGWISQALAEGRELECSVEGVHFERYSGLWKMYVRVKKLNLPRNRKKYG